MRLAAVVLFLSSAIAASAQTMSAPAAQTQPPSTTWPTQDGTYIIKNFRFGTGETLPELKLHYLTLGTPAPQCRRSHR